MVARIATRYPRVSRPDCSEDMPAATWTRPRETISVPAAPLRRKLDRVAPANVALRNSFRFRTGLLRLVSIPKNTSVPTTATAMSPMPVQLSQPISGPCEMYTLRATSATTRLTMPPQSKVPPAFAADLDSGVPRSRNRATTESTIEIQKMDRQPRNDVAIRPPNRAQKPEPPHEPMDQNDSARWRSSPRSSSSPGPWWRA